MNRFLSQLFGVLVACASVLQAAEPWRDEPQQTLATVAGSFEITTVGTGGQLRLNHQFLREFDSDNLSIAAQWPSDAPPRLLLLDISTSSASCPDLFMVIDLPTAPSQKAALTHAFGNCADRPSVTFSGQEWTIAFSPFNHGKAWSWIYDLNRRALIDPRKGSVTGPLH